MDDPNLRKIFVSLMDESLKIEALCILTGLCAGIALSSRLSILSMGAPDKHPFLTLIGVASQVLGNRFGLLDFVTREVVNARSAEVHRGTSDFDVQLVSNIKHRTPNTETRSDIGHSDVLFL
jgi:hypothetical protein